MEKIKEQNKTKKLNLEDFLLNYALYIVLFIMIVVFIIKEPTFLSINNFTKILTKDTLLK